MAKWKTIKNPACRAQHGHLNARQNKGRPTGVGLPADNQQKADGPRIVMSPPMCRASGSRVSSKPIAPPGPSTAEPSDLP